MNFAKSHHATGAMTIAIATALTLSACGGNSADSAGSGEPAADEVAEGSAHGDFPVTVEHEFGDTTIESEPERVISIGWGDLDNLLALDVTPVGYYVALGLEELPPWTAELMGDAESENLGDTTEFDFEEIAALEPDLIIAVDGAAIDEENYSILSDIAPTVTRPAGTGAWEVSREDGAHQISEAVGKPEEAQATLDELDEKIAATREEFPELQGKTGVVGWTAEGGDAGAYTALDGRGAFLELIGMDLPQIVQDADEGSFNVELASEEVGRLDGDVVMFLAEDLDEDPTAQNTLLEQFDATFLPLHGANRYALSVDTPQSVSYALENLVPEIDDAIDQSPGQ